MFILALLGGSVSMMIILVNLVRLVE